MGQMEILISDQCTTAAEACSIGDLTVVDCTFSNNACSGGGFSPVPGGAGDLTGLCGKQSERQLAVYLFRIVVTFGEGLWVWVMAQFTRAVGIQAMAMQSLATARSLPTEARLHRVKAQSNVRPIHQPCLIPELHLRLEHEWSLLYQDVIPGTNNARATIANSILAYTRSDQ